MLSHTSTEWAPWYVIPADRKWFARIGAAAVLVNTLMEIDPRFPPVTDQQRQALLEIGGASRSRRPGGPPPTPSNKSVKTQRTTSPGAMVRGIATGRPRQPGPRSNRNGEDGDGRQPVH